MSGCPYKNFRSKVLDFIKVLRTPREEFGGLPPCPFVGSEVDRDKLMIDLFDPSKNTFLEMVDSFVNSNFDSALFVQVSNTEISREETFQYQKFLNKVLKQSGHKDLKCICTNPSETYDADGFNVRQHAPYFLINIANKHVLHKAHNRMLNTKYFDKMSEEYLDYLRVEKKRRRNNEE